MAIKISVIVPVYNVEAFLENSLNSIANQSFADFEVLCIDDGSTDNSLKILREFQLKDKRFKVYTQLNKGAGSARNLGISLANAKYILFFDSDDRLAPNALQKCYAELVSNNLDVLLFDARSEFLSVGLEKKFSWYKTAYSRSKQYGDVVSGEDMFNLMFSVGDYIVSPCMYMFSREILFSNDLSFETGIVYEDNIFTLKLLMFAKRVKHIKEQLYIRLVRDNSTVTKNITQKNLYSYYRCFVEIYFFAKANIISPRTQRNISILLNSIKRHMTNQSNQLKQSESYNSMTYIDKYLINLFSSQEIDNKPSSKPRTYSEQKSNLFTKTINSLKSGGILVTLKKIIRYLCTKLS